MASRSDGVGSGGTASTAPRTDLLHYAIRSAGRQTRASRPSRVGDTSVIIILKPNVSEDQIQHVLERVQSLGLQAHLSRGTYRTIIGIIGDEEQLQFEPLLALPGVHEVIPVLPPYKLASREAHPRSSIVDVAASSSAGRIWRLIAGPCARSEDAEQMLSIAKAVKAAGAHILRGGAYKPRTSPYSFQGLEEEGCGFCARRAMPMACRW